LEFTGERYVPELDWPEISYEHWHRYLFARDHCGGKVVLDVASGEGYGAARLAEVAVRVVGVDADPAAVVHAAATYRRDNLEFRAGPAEKIPVEGEAVFDLVVSFETIEHLDTEAQERFVAEVRRLLKPAGRLIVSTPNKRTYTDAPGYSNPFHRREFYEDEFAELLRRRFRHVRLLAQRVYPVSYLWPVGANGRPIAEKQLAFEGGRFGPPDDDRKESLYLIAICSDADLVPPDGSVLLDTSERATRHRLEESLRKDQAVETLGRELREQADRAAAALKAERGRADRTEAELADTRASLTQSRERLAAVTARLEYERGLAAVRGIVRSHVRAGSTVAVVTKGDERLLDFPARGWHFPRAAGGEFAGYYPADDSEAVIHLEGLRTAGGDYFLLPAPAFWWLDHYAGFRRHLEARYTLVHRDAEVMLFDLRRPGSLPPEVRAPGGRATVVVPGSVNYFHDRAGQRIADALNDIGVNTEVSTLDATDRGGEWCFLINPYEVAFGSGGDAAVPLIADLRRRYDRVVAVLMECAETPWFGMSIDVCRRAGVTRVLDLGFHGQYESIPDEQRPTYVYAFSGLTGAERRAIPTGRAAGERPIPWVFVGHSAGPRLSVIERLLRSVDPGGFVYMPNIGPVRDRGPHLNGEQLQRVLRRSRCQIWCSHHGRFYMESERFRDSLLAGCVPVKIGTAAADRPDYLPFRFLTKPEQELIGGWDGLDSADTWERFAAEFAALPTLEESLAGALRSIAQQEAGNGR
jgi:SAM-dependent methyltransferase